MITVYCDDPSHPERLWEYEFMRVGPGWVMRPTGRFSPKGLSRHNVVTTLEGDRRLPREAPRPDFHKIRRSYNLRCKICGWTLSRRDETLRPVFDKLEEAGIERVSMKAIAALH